MSTTSSVDITIRDNADLTVFRGPLISGGIVYHGAYVALATDGYWKNAVSTLSGIRAVGIVKSSFLTDQAVTASATPGVMTATANGDLVNNTNCIDIYLNGEFEATFESTSGLTIANEGDTVYLYDNNTLTVNPALGFYPVGKLSKYKSATVGSVILLGLNSGENKSEIVLRGTFSGQLADTSGFVVKSLANPFGAAVVVRDFALAVHTSGSTAMTGYAGIAPTSSNVVATFIMSSSSINFGVVGIASPWNDPITHSTLLTTADGGLDRLWKSTEYLSIVASSSGNTTLAGWYQIVCVKI